MHHDMHDAESWIGQDLVGVDSQPVGTIEDIYVDAATELPEWAAVKASGFGGGVTFVPLAEAQPRDDGVRVPYSWATIQSAPGPKPDGELTQDEEAQLYDHYGLVYGQSRSGSGLPEYEDDPAICEEQHEVVLHEEEVVVERRAVPRERVRMTKQHDAD